MHTVLKIASTLPLVLGVVACQDPSGVGLGIIDETGGVPGTRVIEGVDVATDSTLELTGGFASTSANTPQTRVLFGEVEDNLFGDASAVANVDFLLPGTVENVDAEDITGVRLQLRRTYTYGDTLSTLPIDIREISEEWAPVDLEPDAVLDAGNVIFSAEVAAEDTITFLDFPQDWVTANRARLLDEDFDDTFRGLQLSIPTGGAPSPGAVLGFDMTQSSLDLITNEDTIRYPVWEVFTQLAREEPASPPADIVPLADGRSEALGVTFDLSEYENATVAGGAIRFTIDRNTIPSSGSFVRPIPSNVQLVLLVDDEELVVDPDLAIPEEGISLSISSSSFTQTLQSFVVSDELSQRFRIAFALSPTSLDVLPISLEPILGEGGPPRLALTLIDPE